MKRLLIAGAALALLVAPSGAAAKPTHTDRHNAAQECRDLRGNDAATREAFRVRYGTNKNGRNAFGKCVSSRARAEEKQRKAAVSNAAKACKAERADIGEAAFAAKYGTNPNGKNAFGKCVSTLAKAKKEAADDRDDANIETRKNAARSCAAERSDIGRSEFADKYGSGRHKRNAFGKCVSSTVRHGS